MRHRIAVSTALVSLLSVPAAVVVAIPQAPAPEGATSTRLSAERTLEIRNVGSARISPGGEWVLYSVGSRDLQDEDLARRSAIWRVRVDGTEARQLTHGDSPATGPSWFPGGDRIAFTRSVDSHTQVFAMYTDGGEAWQLTEHPEGVAAYALSPDGTRLWFTALDPESPEAKRRKKQHDDATVIDADSRWTHLWMLDIASGESTRLTDGRFTVSDPRWSPDSTRIAYVTRPSTKVDDGWNSDIHVVDVASAESKLLFANPGPDSSPRWSPDGRTIAFTANRYTGTTVWYSKLYLLPADGSGEPEILLEDFDLNAGAPIWAPNGADIYWSTGDRTRTNLFSVQVATDETRDHDAPPGANFGFEMAPDGGRWVWVHSAPDSPSELYTAPADDLSKARRLTDHNAWLADEGVELAPVRAITWHNSEGQQIEGVVHLPPGFEEGKRYPLIVNPHGGPSGAVMQSFNSTNQMLAANGFIVLQPNFRGSSNYGQEFLNANRNYWGLRDYDDIMTGVDDVIARGWADPDRMVAYGWSYGGYMTFWMSTQTDRFRLISPGAGLSDLYSMYSTTDIPGYLGWFFGKPWDHEDTYLRLSPIRHVKNVSAKMLIMHGANDARVPREQAVEFYQALKDLGKEVTFVSYPRQGHGIREPRLQLDRLRRYVCAFTDAVGLEPTTEACAGDLPAAPAEDAGDEDAEQPGPQGAEASAGLAADPGIFRVIER